MKPSTARRIASSVGKFLLGAGILFGLVWWLGPDWDQVRAQIRFSWGWFLVSFAGTAIATAFTAARWRLIHENMTDDRHSYVVYFQFIAVTRFLGQFTSMLLMDFAGRTAGLKAAGSQQSVGRVLAPMVVERLLDMLLPFTMLGWALAVRHTWVGQYKLASLAIVLVAFGLLVIPVVQPLARLAIAVYVRLKRWRGAVIVDEPVDVAPTKAAWVSIHSIGRFATVLMQFIGAGAAAGALLPWDVVASAFPIEQLTAIIAITPGGLGVQEAGWAGGLRWLEQPEEVITLYLLATRLFVIVNFGLLSLVTLPLGRRRQ